MLSPSHWGLRGRAIALCMLLLLGAVGALATALIWQNYRDSLRSMSRHAAVHARAISYSAEPAVLLGDRDGLRRVAQAAQQDEAVERVLILDRYGRELTRLERHPGFVAEIEVNPTKPMETVPSRRSAFLRQSSSQLLVVVPIWQHADAIDLDLIDSGAASTNTGRGLLGFVGLTYSLAEIQAELRSRMWVSLLVAALVITFGIVVTMVAVRQLLNPLRDLVEATTAIARGERNKRAGEHAVGEIGALARAFNSMVNRVQQSYETIEQTVALRTAELIKANRAKSDFLANMSHEIRTPMTAVVGFAENLLDPNLSEVERIDAIGTIRRNGQHLLRIINDILDISKIESGELKLDCVRCSLLSLVHEVESLMRPAANRKGITFATEYLTRVPETMETDPTRLRQVLINLTNNAVKFTQRGGVTLRIGLIEPPAKEQAGQIRFEVADSGIGMSPGQLENVFKPFSQADETMSRRFGGTGLGLAICRHLVSMLGGAISVTSKVGTGSTFTFTIPVGRLDGVSLIDGDACHEIAAQPNPAGPPAFDDSAPCRVLLAEDGPDNQKLIMFILGKAGIDVALADNGQAAVERVLAAAAAGQPFDLILMDMQMPVMDGYEAVSLLRRHGYRGRIVALTAHAMSHDREKCLAAGCDDYISKPVDRRALLSLLGSPGEPLPASANQS